MKKKYAMAAVLVATLVVFSVNPVLAQVALSMNAMISEISEMDLPASMRDFIDQQDWPDYDQFWQVKSDLYLAHKHSSGQPVYLKAKVGLTGNLCMLDYEWAMWKRAWQADELNVGLPSWKISAFNSKAVRFSDLPVFFKTRIEREVESYVGPCCSPTYIQYYFEG